MIADCRLKIAELTRCTFYGGCLHEFQSALCISSFFNRYRPHHPARHSLFLAVREQQVRPAGRAQVRNPDILLAHSGLQQLPPVRLDQVQVGGSRWFPVARRALVHEQQRILPPCWVRRIHLFEQFSGICKLRPKLVPQVFADLVTAAVNPRANRRLEVRGIAAELPPEFAHALLDNPRQRAAPAGVKRAHRAPHGIGQQHRKAIGNPHRQHDSRPVGDQPISLQRLCRNFIDPVNHAGVDLPHRDRRPSAAAVMDCAERLQKQGAIAYHRSAGVLRRDAQIQRAPAVGFRHAAAPRAEPVQHPGNSGQRVRMNDRDAWRLRTGFWGGSHGRIYWVICRSTAFADS